MFRVPCALVGKSQPGPKLLGKWHPVSRKAFYYLPGLICYLPSDCIRSQSASILHIEPGNWQFVSDFSAVCVDFSFQVVQVVGLKDLQGIRCAKWWVGTTLKMSRGGILFIITSCRKMLRHKFKCIWLHLTVQIFSSNSTKIYQKFGQRSIDLNPWWYQKIASTIRPSRPSWPESR